MSCTELDEKNPIGLMSENIISPFQLFYALTYVLVCSVDYFCFCLIQRMSPFYLRTDIERCKKMTNRPR